MSEDTLALYGCSSLRPERTRVKPVQVVIKETSEQAKRHQTKSKLIPNEIRDTLLSLYILCGILALDFV